ncbi:MAG: F0F1 ATP synthase subunit delta [Candidatus Reddybacter sp.]
MAELSTLARPYAKAAFEYANEKGAVDQWAGMLSLLAGLSEFDAVADLISAPDQTPAEKAEKLIAICGDGLSVEGANFLKNLADNRRLPLLPQIQIQFNAFQAEQDKTLDVDVLAARAMDQAQQDRLAAALQQRLQRTINIKVSVDAALIGGAVIRAGDTIIDGSVSGRLARLAEAINQ